MLFLFWFLKCHWLFGCGLDDVRSWGRLAGQWGEVASNRTWWWVLLHWAPSPRTLTVTKHQTPIQKKHSASHFNCVQSWSYSISVPWVTLNWASGQQKEMSSCFTVFLIHFRSVHLMDQYCFRRPVFLCDFNVVFVVFFFCFYRKATLIIHLLLRIIYGISFVKRQLFWMIPILYAVHVWEGFWFLPWVVTIPLSYIVNLCCRINISL